MDAEVTRKDAEVRIDAEVTRKDAEVRKVWHKGWMLMNYGVMLS